MKIAFFIAWRYLFSKKSHNTINVISGVSAAGVCIATAALICVLSALNGLSSFVEDMFSTFDPSLKITAAEGKSFFINTPEFEQVKALPNVTVFSQSIEDNALIRFKDKQSPAIIKGVDSVFQQLSDIDSIMFDGKFLVHDGAFERCVAGVGLAYKLGLGSYFIEPVKVYAPQRNKKINLMRPESSFNESALFMAGRFSVQQLKYDDAYLLVSIGLARSLYDYDENQVTAVELKIANEKATKKTKKEIRAILGNNFKVLDRYEQQEDFFKMMKIEKWITFLILAFILLIATFNIIGSLSMLIIDKKEDIKTFRNLGADSLMIKRIFLFEGWLVSVCGALIGLFIGTLLCLIQQMFGVIRLGNNFVIDAYPVQVQIWDVLLTIMVVLLMGFLAAWFPTKYIEKTI